MILRPALSRLTVGALGGAAVPQSLFANSRLMLHNGRQQATVAALQFNAGIMTMISPPWACRAPRFCFAGFYGQTGQGEAALGNDVFYEGFDIEIAGVKTQLKVNGSSSFTVPNGSHVLTDYDPAIVIPANTVIRFGWADALPLGAYRPSATCYILPLAVVGTADGRGDASSGGTTSRLSFMRSNVAGGTDTTRQTTFSGGPIMMIAEPVDPNDPIVRAVLHTGNSLGWGQSKYNAPWSILASRYGALGFLPEAMNDPAGGRIPWGNLCIPGTRFRDLIVGGAGAVGENGFTMRAAALAAMGFPYTCIVDEMGINSVASFVGATAIQHAQAAGAALKSYGNRKILKTLLSMQTTSTDDPSGTINYWNWTSTDEAKQQRASDGSHVAVDEYYLDAPPNVDGVIDIRPAIESSPGSRKWKAGGFSGALTSAVSSGTVLMLDTKPAEGSHLLIDGGSSSLLEAVRVTSVSGASAPFTVNVRAAITKSHGVGATIAEQPTDDGTHMTRLSTERVIPVLCAAKPDIPALSAGLEILAPVNLVAPVIYGTPQVGQTVRLPNGTWSGSPTKYVCQWLVDGVVVATSRTYTLVTGQETKTLVGRVTASNAGGPASVSSVAVTIQSATPQMPSGAAGIWYVRQADTTATRSVVPNEVTKASTTVPKPINDPTITAENWARSGVTATTGQADEKGRPQGVLCVCSGAWSMRCDNFVNFNAGPHFLAQYAKATAPVDVRVGMDYDVSGAPAVTIGTSWTRLPRMQTKGAGLDNPINIVPVTPGSATITLGSTFIYEGATDPFPSGEAGGHMWLGTTAKASKPPVAANEMDITGNVRVLAMLDAAITVGGSTGSATMLIATRRTAAFTTSQGLAAGHRNGNSEFGEPFAGFTSLGNSPALQMNGYDIKGYRDNFTPGKGDTLFNPLNRGYNIWGFTHDGATSRTYVTLNGVAIAGDITAAVAAQIGSLIAPHNDGAGGFANSFALYPKALSKTELAAAVDALRAEVTASSLSLDTTANFVYWAGDSNTQGAADTAPGGRGFPYLYKASAGTDHYAFMFAKNGGKLADMVAQALVLDFSPALTAKAGRKFVLVGMIGTNDTSTTFTSDANTYASNLLAYWAARKTAGYTTVGIGMLPRTDVNAASGTEAWRTTVNNALAGAVGNQLDAYVNLNDDPNLGLATAPNNTTFFNADKVHLTNGAGGGQAALAVLVKAKLDPILAA